MNSYYQDGVFEPLVPNISTPQYDYSSDYGNILKPMSRVSVVDNGTKVILLDLVEADVTNYIVDSLYIEFIRPITDAKGYITRRIDTFKNVDVPFDFRSVTYRRFEADFSLNQNSDYMGTAYNLFMDSYNFGGYIGAITTTGNYKDLLSVSNVDTTDFKVECSGGPCANWYRGYYDNVVTDYIFGGKLNYAVNATINSMSYFTMVGYLYYSIMYGFTNTNINGSVYNSLIDYMMTTDINTQNMYASKIKGQSQNNIINVGYIYGWDVGANFQSNHLTSNSMQWFVTTGSGFRNVTLNCDLNGQDFSLASIVYGNYSKNIFTNSNSQPRLSYVNGSDILTITTVTA